MVRLLAGSVVEMMRFGKSPIPPEMSSRAIIADEHRKARKASPRRTMTQAATSAARARPGKMTSQGSVR